MAVSVCPLMSRKLLKKGSLEARNCCCEIYNEIEQTVVKERNRIKLKVRYVTMTFDTDVQSLPFLNCSNEMCFKISN